MTTRGERRFVRRFLAPDGSTISVSSPTEEQLGDIETAWKAGRTPATEHWNWSRIASESREVLLLSDINGSAVALFATRKRRLLEIESHKLYCVDFLEVAPQRRGQGVGGPLALAAAAARARSLGADGLALPVLSGLEKWYRKAVSAVPISKYSWKPGKDLVPMKVVGEAFDDLVEVVDGSQAE